MTSVVYTHWACTAKQDMIYTEYIITNNVRVVVVDSKEASGLRNKSAQFPERVSTVLIRSSVTAVGGPLRHRGWVVASNLALVQQTRVDK